MSEETIAAGAFKARCLKLMAEVQRTKSSLVITKRGTPVVRIEPYIDEKPDTLFGCMTGTASWRQGSRSIQQPQTAKASSALANTKAAIDFTPEQPPQASDSNQGEDIDEEIDFDAFVHDETRVSDADISIPRESSVAKSERKSLPIRRSPPPNKGLPLKHEQPPAPPEEAGEESEEDIYVPPSGAEQQVEPASGQENNEQEAASKSEWLMQKLSSSWNRKPSEETEES